jgi:hypothetical protein
MAAGIKIDESTYKRVKRQLIFRSVKHVALDNRLSFAKVVKIKATRNYEQFREIVKAEHPPEKESSLRKKVSKLEEQMATVLDKLAT